MKRIRAVAVVINDGEVLLMHRKNSGKEYWVFPGGGVEPNETIEDAVLREVKEETTLEIEIKKLIYHHVYDDNTEQFFFLCRYISGEPRLGDSEEAIEMSQSDVNFYDPGWYEVRKIGELLLYPLEIKDWFLSDIKTDFKNTPREVFLKIEQLRQTL